MDSIAFEKVFLQFYQVPFFCDPRCLDQSLRKQYKTYNIHTLGIFGQGCAGEVRGIQWRLLELQAYCWLGFTFSRNMLMHSNSSSDNVWDSDKFFNGQRSAVSWACDRRSSSILALFAIRSLFFVVRFRTWLGSVCLSEVLYFSGLCLSWWFKPQMLRHKCIGQPDAADYILIVALSMARTTQEYSRHKRLKPKGMTGMTGMNL